MKPLTKTVVSRGGGIAGRFAKGGDAPEARRSKRTNQPETPPAASPQKPAAGAKPKFDRVAYQREYMRQWRAKRKK